MLNVTSELKLSLKILIIIGAFILLLFLNNPLLFKAKQPFKDSYRKELIDSAVQAIKSRDVPIAALLIYRGNIIGRGYNTVKALNDAGHHAEINAISSAIDRFGFDQFKQLDRDSLEMITSFEPCPMCAGAIIIYNIRHVSIIKQKSWIENRMNDLRLIRYRYNLEQVDNTGLQDSLFQLHPDFNKKK